MAEPLPNRPGLHDVADWKLVSGVPDTIHATPHGAHWAALLRLFSWQIQRVAELEERVQVLETKLALMGEWVANPAWVVPAPSEAESLLIIGEGLIP